MKNKNVFYFIRLHTPTENVGKVIIFPRKKILSQKLPIVFLRNLYCWCTRNFGWLCSLNYIWLITIEKVINRHIFVYLCPLSLERYKRHTFSYNCFCQNSSVARILQFPHCPYLMNYINTTIYILWSFSCIITCLL